MKVLWFFLSRKNYFFLLETLTDMKGEDNIVDLVRRLELSLLQPDVRQSPSQVATLLADDFVEFGASGRIFDKAQVVAGLAAEQHEPPARRTVDQMKIRLLAEGVALVTYRVESRRDGGAAVTSLRSSIWTREAGHWRLSFHQGTTSPA
jgi:hypothetical protein